MKHIIIGIRGRVGTDVYRSIGRDGNVHVSGIDRGGVVVTESDFLSECGYGDEFDEMHVCIPYLDARRYCEDVRHYAKVYPSKKVILHSKGVPLTIVEDLCVTTGRYVVARMDLKKAA